jgi:hypothetical protein
VCPRIPKSLKLSLRGSVEITSSTSAGSAEEAEDRVGWYRSDTQVLHTEPNDAKKDIPLGIYFGS